MKKSRGEKQRVQNDFQPLGQFIEMFPDRTGSLLLGVAVAQMMNRRFYVSANY
jgi:hypothetical protein